VHNEDLDEALNPGALYIAELQTTTRDDSDAGNQYNNVSHRMINIGPAPSFMFLGFAGDTFIQQPALQAWQNHDPAVAIETIQVPDDGRFMLGYKVTDSGKGTWHYEYALYNMNSHRSAKAFIVPVPAGVTLTNIGFHDVDYHSGDGVGGVTYDGTDWALDTTLGQVRWFTDGVGNPNANALRWGTLYNFRFDADTPPAPADLTITPYRVGVPLVLTVTALGPSQDPCPWDTDGDDNVGITESLVAMGCRHCQREAHPLLIHVSVKSYALH